MKRLFLYSITAVLLFSLGIVTASAQVKTKKVIRENKVVKIFEQESSQISSTSSNNKSTTPQRVAATTTPAAGVVIGNTDYDYGWNSGHRKYLVVDTAGTVAHMIFMERDQTASTTALQRRAIKYAYYTWSDGSIVTGYPVPKATAASGFGAVDVFWTGDAKNTAAVTGHTDTWLAFDGAPGSGNFTYAAVPSPGTVDPSITIEQSTNTIYYNDSHDANRTNIFVSKTGDYGTTWSVIDSALITHVAGSLFVMGTIDNKVLIAPNGNLAIATTITGAGTWGTVSYDSADAIGYFESTNKGTSWTWHKISVDGASVLYGADTVYNYYENFGDLDAVYDKNSNLHIVSAAQAVKVVNDSTEQRYWGTLYWKTGLSNFKFISTDAHYDEYDTVATNQTYSGNGYGFPYPAITVDPKGNGLFAIWSQPEVVSGHVQYAWTGYEHYNLWYATSQDLGTTWSAPTELSNSQDALFSVTNQWLTKPTSSTYRAHVLYLQDTSAGEWVGSQGVHASVPWIYRTIDFANTTGIIGGANSPKKFSVEQNYPNPFNPATTIAFHVPSSSVVSVKVFDVLGREVATLLNEEKSAGDYSVQFDASKLSSGVYIYRLQAGSFTDSKKMVLMK
jgi:hypothetical protein